MRKYFVKSRPHEPKKSESVSRDFWSAWRDILALHKLGFSFDEIRQMNMRDFVAFTDIAFSDEENDPKTYRDATQDDIDKLLG